MRTFTLYDGREYMKVNENGEISRPAIKMPASGQWRVIGAARYNNFGHQVEFARFPECAAIKDWQHKNGKQKWFLIDYDHGTRRQWGGIAQLWEAI